MRAPSRRRRAAAAIAVAALLVACSPDSDPSPDTTAPPGGNPPPGEPGNAPSQGAPGGAAQGGGDPSDPASPPAGGAGVPADTAGLGAMCRHYLRADVPRLLVEVDWEDGAQPSETAFDHLLRVLGGVADKPAGAALASGSGSIGPGDRERVWSAAALREVARRERSNRSSSREVVVYVLAVRGRFEDEGAIGVAHNATEMAIFPERISGLATGLLGGRTALERSVLVHELGHLLCLINIGYRSELGHEDPEHPHHSRDRASVMHWAIDTSMVGQLFNGPPPDDFTEQDRADLEGLRTGRY